MANKRIELLLVISLFTFVNLGGSSLVETDTLAQGLQLKDSGSDHLVSASRTFKLGFFSTGTSNRYVGIWYNVQPANNTEETLTTDTIPVWVANRNTPLHDKSGILMIDEIGNLKISHSEGNPLVLSPAQTPGNLSATLLDSGNFILKRLSLNGSTEQIIWQSFDYPTDTLLPGMKLGINFKTGHNWSLTSWISSELPASGSFTLSIDPSGASQMIISWQGGIFWSSGLWRNRSKHFDLATKLSYESGLEFSYTENEHERYFSFSVNKNQSRSRYKISLLGFILENSSAAAPFGQCGLNNGYGLQSFFYPPSDHGCVPQGGSACKKKSAARPKPKKAFPLDKFKFDEYYNLSFYDCGVKCIRDCSCVAFTSDCPTAICEIWSKGLGSKSRSLSHTKTRQLLTFSVDDVDRWSARKFAAIMVLPIVGLALFSVVIYVIVGGPIRRKGSPTEAEILLKELDASGENKDGERKKREFQIFSFETLANATNNFAVTNKLGEGGFGSVYKGVLPSGQYIAVKRLSSNSRQGLEEFKNEALLISKLQHMNLVSLEGCCLGKEEKMLIYEYMQNKSLDFFLFDTQRKNVLNWEKRYNIIDGIGQGLLYLHKYSRLKVIHRDLKASNILLDDDMNPKISDFGMARIFGHNEPRTNTTRIVETYDYMSLEYAMNGIYSTKSDMFSFGVLLLEILSGRKNNSFRCVSGPLNLAGYAWELWRENRALELIDPSLGDSYPSDEVMRCLHVGLLCVQDNPAARPSILDALSMIYSEGNQLPAPKQPAYHYGSARELAERERDLQNCSLNKVTITEMEAR